MNYLRDKEAAAEFVVKVLKQKGNLSLLTTTTEPEKLEASCAVTAITASSDGTETVIYFDGWLVMSNSTQAGSSQKRKRDVERSRLPASELRER